jgi:simple sugar transport system ATP-binding protein
MSSSVLEARAISKSFGYVRSLDGVDLTINAGEVLALVGDNGAGKSTLANVLSGVLQPDAGEIRIDGKPVVLSSPLAAREFGIETVYQDLALSLDLNAIQNLFLGREIMAPGLLGRLGFLDRAKMRAAATQCFTDLAVRIPNVQVAVANYSGGQRQGVAVARAVLWARRIVFMDEPTAALGVAQTRNVLDLIRRIRDTGVGVVLISHSMPDVMAVSDRISVLRLGRLVRTYRKDEVTGDQLVAAMTGTLDATVAHG